MMDEIALAAMLKQQEDENKPGQGGNTGNSSTGVSLPHSSGDARSIQLSAPQGVPGQQPNGYVPGSSSIGGGESAENSSFRSKFSKALDDQRNAPPPSDTLAGGAGQAVGMGAAGLLRNYGASQADANGASGKRNQTPPKDEGT